MPGSWEIVKNRDSRILLAIICPPDLGITLDFAQAIRGLQLPPGSDFMRVVGLPYGPARNSAAKAALTSGYNLAFLDSDVRVESDAYIKLLATGLDLVSGLYYQRYYPYIPVAFNEGKDDSGKPIKVPVEFRPGDIFPCTFIPSGLTLYKRRMLDICMGKWPRFFEWGVDLTLVPCEDGYVPPFSEDFVASYRARQMGFQGYVHAGVVGLHECRAVVGPRWIMKLPISPDPMHGVIGVLQ